MKRNYKQINTRCEKLIEMGFTIAHEDSRVYHGAVPGVEFDFSGVDEKHFIASALAIVGAHYYKSGRNSVKEELNKSIQIEE